MQNGTNNFGSGNLMTAQVLADKINVTAQQVRYYTRRGLLKPARHPRNRYQLYRESDVARLHFILKAKNLGYTLSEISKIFAESYQGESPCPLARKIIVSRIADNRKKLDEMLELQTRMETTLAKWANLPDKLPDGYTVCHLIESTP